MKLKRMVEIEVMSKLDYQIGQRARQLREQAGLSQGDVARKLKTTQSTYSRLETGVQGWTVTMLYKVAAVVKRTPQEILTYL